MGSHRGRKFRVNRAEGKVLGVCAGLADHFDMDPTLVRVAMALVILMTMPIGLIAYVLLALIADRPVARRRVGGGEAAAPVLTEAGYEATRQRMHDLDARLAAIETCVTSSSSALAREIESLR